MALSDAADRRAGGYSLGMRQRLGLAAALLGDPQVLVLDEPANGLDPQGIRWLRDFLRTLAAEGRAMLVSSHVLAEVAQTADDVVVINKGRSVAQAPLSEIMARSGGGMKVAGPDVRKLGDILYQQGAEVSGDSARDPRQGPHGRADRPRGGRAPARDLRARARRVEPRRGLPRTHRIDRRTVMIRLLDAEIFKLRTTRTFYGIVGGRWG